MSVSIGLFGHVEKTIKERDNTCRSDDYAAGKNRLHRSLSLSVSRGCCNIPISNFLLSVLLPNRLVSLSASSSGSEALDRIVFCGCHLSIARHEFGELAGGRRLRYFLHSSLCAGSLVGPFSIFIIGGGGGLHCRVVITVLSSLHTRNHLHSSSANHSCLVLPDSLV